MKNLTKSKPNAKNVDFQIFENLEAAADNYHVLHENTGGSSEFDKSINEISRAKIILFHRIHGSCFLYKLNKWKESDPDFWEYKGEKIYNFDASFMTDKPDVLLCKMVADYNKPKDFFDSKKTMADIKQIFDRLGEIKGVILSWA